MAYIGKNLVGVLKEQKSVSTLTGNGSTTTLTLSDTPGSVNNVLVFFDGIRQQPITDYTLSGTTLTFIAAPEAGVIVTAIVGNHSGVNPKPNSVTESKIVDGSVTSDNISSIAGSQVTGLASSKLTGALPAVDGSALTGLAEHTQITKSASDPTLTTNPSDGLGTIWCNTTTGNMYVCTDITTNSNTWTNMGKGTGDILNFAPTNYTDSFPDLIENASTNYTFSGASDSDGTVAHYLVEQISNPSLLAVTTAEMANTQAHTFTTQPVSEDTDVTFVVKTKDNLGKYSSGVTVTVTILNNVAPSNPTNTASFADMNQNASQNFTFTGATDPDAGDTVTHYMVDQISNAVLTVSAAEVAAGSPHAFSAGGVSSDTAVTFRVRAKDDKGNYSSGVTVSMTVIAFIPTVASGGDHTYTRGDYTYQVFKNNGTLQVTAVGDDSSLDYLVVAGGAGSGGWGAGGAGGVKSSVTNTGQNGSLLSSITASVTSYNITIGGGGNGAGSVGTTGGDGSPSTFHTVTSTGGGGGAGWSGGANGNGRQGGSGGSGNKYYGGNPGPGIAGEGNDGGQSTTSGHSSGGGGGAGAIGGTGGGAGQAGGDGGIGVTSVMMNTSESNTYSVGDVESGSVYFAGGGGGCAGPVPPLASGGHGGGGRGGNNIPTSPIAGTEYTGGGAGAPYNSSDTKNGGKGVVIVRYKTS